MLQNMIVWIIGVVVFALIAVKFYKLIVAKKNNKCSGCSSCGCDKKEKCDK